MLFNTRYFVCNGNIPLELYEENIREDIKKYFLYDDVRHNDVHIMEYQKYKEPKKYKIREDNFPNLKSKSISNRVSKGILKSMAGFVRRYSHCTKIIVDLKVTGVRLLVEKYDNGIILAKLTGNQALGDIPGLLPLLDKMDAGEIHVNNDVRFVEELTSQPASLDPVDMSITIKSNEPRTRLI